MHCTLTCLHCTLTGSCVWRVGCCPQAGWTAPEEALLRHLLHVDPDGPWFELVRSGQPGPGLDTMREAFTSCLEVVDVFVPNTLLEATGVQVGTSAGAGCALDCLDCS